MEKVLESLAGKIVDLYLRRHSLVLRVLVKSMDKDQGILQGRRIGVNNSGKHKLT